MIEVEVKAKINSFEEIKNELKKINATKTKIEYQEDTYFNSPLVDYAKTDEALRIRETKTKENKKIFITYKGPKIDKKSKTREEIEMKIEDKDKASKIFKHLGFEKVRTVKKKREYYSYKEFEISLDDVKGLNPYMEIEIGLNDEEDYSKSQKAIFDLFKKMNITEGFETKSYLELLEIEK